jgi:hypothetical protein
VPNPHRARSGLCGCSQDIRAAAHHLP